jgi:hypothetical protein
MVMEGRWRVTLRKVAALAAVLGRWKRPLVGIGTLAGAWLLFEVWQVPSATPRLLGALSLFLWILLALGVGLALPKTPAPVANGAGMLERWLKCVAWVAYGLVVVIALALAGLTLAITSRAVGIWAS